MLKSAIFAEKATKIGQRWWFTDNSTTCYAANVVSNVLTKYCDVRSRLLYWRKSGLRLEHFQKYCSHPVGRKEAAVLLGFGVVFAQLQAALGLLLRSSLAKTQNSSLPNGHSISSNALAEDFALNHATPGTLSFQEGGTRLLSLWAAILAAAIALPTLASQSVELEWTPSINSDVVGYNVYYGGASNNYTNEISVGNLTNLTVSGLADGTTYYFAVTAVENNGLESGYSAETVCAVPSAAALLGPPLVASKGVSIAVTGVPGYLYVIETSTNLVNWVKLQTNVVPLLFTDTNALGCPKKFYRVVYN